LSFGINETYDCIADLALDLALDLHYLWPWLGGLGLGLDIAGLFNIPDCSSDD